MKKYSIKKSQVPIPIAIGTRTKEISNKKNKNNSLPLK
jgi:hypothetical protein